MFQACFEATNIPSGDIGSGMKAFDATLIVNNDDDSIHGKQVIQ
jgi:hypothetical protein